MKNVEVILFLVGFGFFLYYPVFGQLMFNKRCSEHYKMEFYECLHDSKINTEIQKDNNKWILWLYIIQWIPSLISPLMLNFMATSYSPENLMVLPCLGFLITLLLGILYEITPNVSFKYFVNYIVYKNNKNRYHFI